MGEALANEAPAASRSRGGAVRRLQALLLALLGCWTSQSTNAAPLRLEPQRAPSDSSGLSAAQRGTSYFANLGRTGEVSLWKWDADRKRLARLLTIPDAASAMRLTNDGGADDPLLAIGTLYGEIKLYDTAGRLVCQSRLPQGGDIVQIDASVAQNVIVAADWSGAVHLLDAKCNERKIEAYKHDRAVTGIVLHKNVAITASRDGTLGALVLKSAEPLPRMRFSGDEPYGIGVLALAEDGSRLALQMSSDLHVFDVEEPEQMFRSGRKPKLVRKLNTLVESLAILRPGDRLLYQDMYRRLILCDLSTGVTKQLGPEGSVSQFAVAADGKTIYVAPRDDWALKVFRLGFTQVAPPVRLSTAEAIGGIAIANGRIASVTNKGKIRFISEDGIQEPGGGDTGKEVYSFGMSRDGSTIALASSGIGIEVIDTKTLAAETHYYGRLAFQRASGNNLGNMQTTALDFFPDGKSFAATSTFGVVSLWDRGKTEPVKQYSGDSPRLLRISPDGQRVALMAGDFSDDTKKKRVIVANFKDREGRFEIPEPHGKSLVRSIAFSAKGDLLVTVGSDNRTKVWSSKDGKIVEQFAMDHPVGVHKAEFIEGDQALLLFMEDGSVAVLDRRVGAAPQLRYLADARAWSVERLEAKAAAVSSDGSLAAVGTRDGSVLVWREGLQLLAEVRSSSVSLVTMAIRSNYLICGDSNSAPMCWDLQSGLLPAPAQAEKGDVVSIAPSPGGRAIAASREAGFVSVWPADSPSKAVTIPTDGVSGRLRWSLDGSTIYLVGASQGEDVVVRLTADGDGSSARLQASWKAPAPIAGLFPLEGGAVAVKVGHELQLLDSSFRETERISMPEGCAQSWRFQPVSFLSRDLIAYSCDGRVVVMKRDAGAWRQVLGQETRSTPSGFAFDAQQSVLVSGHGSGDLNFWALQTGKLAARLSVGQPIQTLGIRGGTLVAGSSDGQLHFYGLSDRTELGRAILDSEGAVVLSVDGWYGVSGRSTLPLASLDSSKESEFVSSRNSMSTVNAVLLERDLWTVRVQEILARQAALARGKFASLSFLEQLGVTAAALYLALVLVVSAAWVLVPGKLFVWSIKLSNLWATNSLNRLQGSS